VIARTIGYAKLAELQGAVSILNAFAGNHCLPEQVRRTRGLSVRRSGVNERQHRNGGPDSGPSKCGHQFLPMRQEFLKALTGSMRIARRAGTTQASTKTRTMFQSCSTP